MDKKINKILIILTIFTFIITLTGCRNSKKETEVSKAKDNMLSDLDNFSISATITAQTGIVDISIDVNCKQDNKNKIEYCKTSTLGIIETEQYIDSKNNKIYTKTTALFGGDENNGKWITQKYNSSASISDSWLNINDYLEELTITEENGGKLYKGNINSKKINEAISKSDTSSKISTSGSTKNIPIEIFINSNGYIETTNTEFEFASMKEVINIRYSGFNTTGDIIIPSDIK